MKPFNKNIYRLTNAIYENKIDVAIKILEKHPEDASQSNSYSDTPIYMASQRRRKDFVDLFLSKGADINSINSYGFTPLLYAVKTCPDMVPFLIDRGANVKIQRSGYKESVLHYTSYNNDTELAQFLIDKGADVNAKYIGKNKKTPLYIATKYKQDDMIKLLLANGAK